MTGYAVITPSSAQPCASERRSGPSVTASAYSHTILTTPATSRVRRFIRDISATSTSLSFRDLIEHVECAGGESFVRYGHQVTTVAVHARDLPHRYAVGIAAFRLTQYLRTGYASTAVAARHHLFCEPLASFASTDWHVLCLDDITGQLLGYIEFAGISDPDARPVIDPARARFPVEATHDIDLFSHVPTPPGLTTHDVREVKRFVHSGSLADKHKRLRVSLELLLGLGSIVEKTYPRIKSVIGDVESHVALRHILILGLDAHILAGTTPSLPKTALLHPAYTTRECVQPFYADVPTLDETIRRRRVL